MRTTIIAMLHQGQTSAAKMDQLPEAFWWPGMHRQIQEKAETCPSCRSAGKNIIKQIPSMEKNNLEALTAPNQDIQLDFAGLIKSKTRDDVYILVAFDRFSKWPTAQVCKNTDTRTVLKFLPKYFTDKVTPRCIRTDNSSCFKSNDFKKFCNGENIKRIRCTPNLHTGTGLVERTIRTIKSLTRANMADGLILEDSVHVAIKTIKQTPHRRLNMLPFQMYSGRKPRTELADNPTQSYHSGTPIHDQEIDDTTETGEESTGKLRSKQKMNYEKTQTRTELEPCRSERIRSAQRVVKLGGVENF